MSTLYTPKIADATTNLGHALAYTAFGWRVAPAYEMIPDVITGGLRCACGLNKKPHKGCAPGKHPRTHHGLKDATTDPAIIRDWWTKWPNANLLILTGIESGVFVIDIDIAKGGEEEWQKIEREGGELPPTVEVLTGGGGRHLYFAHPGGGGHMKTCDSLLAPGVDIRGDGGYVIAPPSNHKLGHHYEWEASGHPDEVAVAEAPDWLLERLRAAGIWQPEGKAVAPAREPSLDPVHDVEVALDCLAHLSTDKVDRADKRVDWLNVGMVLHSVSDDLLPAWITFSMRRMDRFERGACETEWATFKRDKDGGIKLGSLVYWAKEDGYRCRLLGKDDFDRMMADFSAGRPYSVTTSSVPVNEGPGPKVTEPPADAAAAEPAQPASRVRPVFSNVIEEIKETTDKNGKVKRSIIRIFVPLPDAVVAMQRQMAGYPRRVAGVPFVLKEQSSDIASPDCVQMLVGQDQLMAAIARVCDTNWASGTAISAMDGTTRTVPTKAELFAYAAANLEPNYKSVEVLPHHPPIDNAFYLPAKLPEGPFDGGSPLKRLVESLNPETELDRLLLLAMLLTPGWGGPEGARPIFGLTSDHGRGTGKTVTASIFSLIWGGAISVNPRDDGEQIVKRLLGNESQAIRVISVDNVKGRMSDGRIEGLVTASTIDGWKPFYGQCSRANLFTWYLTANSPSLSKDLADRTVIIKIGAQRHTDVWTSWAGEFVRKHRAAILGELMAFLRDSPLCTIAPANRDRWAAWQDGVLSRFEQGNEMAALYKSRRSDADGDEEDAEDLRGAFVTLIQANQLDPDRVRVLIPRGVLYTHLINTAVVDRTMSPRGVVSFVKDRCGSGALSNVSIHRGRTVRYWLWRGEDAAPDSPLVPLSISAVGVEEGDQ